MATATRVRIARAVVHAMGFVLTLFGMGVFLHWWTLHGLSFALWLLAVYGGPVLIGFAGPRYFISLAGPSLIGAGWVIVMLTMNTGVFFVFNVAGMTISLCYAGYVLVSPIGSQPATSGTTRYLEK